MVDSGLRNPNLDEEDDDEDEDVVRESAQTFQVGIWDS